MNSTVPVSPGRDSRGLLIAVMVILMAALLWFVYGRAHYLTDFTPASYTPYFWPRRAGLALHLIAGITAIVAGLIQVWLGLTQRIRTLHRVLGKVYAGAVALGSLGGFYLAFTIPGQLAYRMGLVCLDVAWLVTTGMALYAVHLRRIEQHREWMLRSYTVTFAFVTYRIFDEVVRHWLSLPDTTDADDLSITMAWASWAVPLLLAEALIQLRNLHRAARGAARTL